MPEFVAGEVVVPVVPSADGFVKTLKKQLVPGAYSIGQEIGKEIQRGISDQLKGIYEPLREQTRRQQQQAPKDGAQVGGAFARGVKSALEAAFRSLPKVELDADSSEAQRKVQELRTRIETLSGKTVGIDIDAGAAQAEVAAIQRELSAIDGQDVSVDVRADVAAALSALTAVDQESARLNGRTANVRVDADVAGALAGIGAVAGALAALPAVAALGLGAGGLAGLAGVAGVGIAGLAAVAIPSLSRINDSLKAQQSAATGAAGAVRNLAIEGAQAQIAQLQAANAADQLKQAQDRVKEAVAGVSQAKDRLKTAVAAAASAQVAAAQRAASAERSLADAQRQALRAQEDLNKARAEAIKHLQDVARSLRGNALDQRQAALDLKEAEADLTAARKGGNADEIERASIAYERTQLRVEELAAEQGRLNDEQAKGVEGNDRVVSAKEQVESANRRVIDAERDLAKAYQDAGKAGEDAAKRVADARKAVRDAEKRVDDAKTAQERIKRDQKIAKLQEKIRAEQAKQAARQSPAASAAPAPDLSPAEQAAAKSIEAFKKSYEKFQKDLGSSVLPVITGGLKVVEGLFKPLTPLIKGTSGALVKLADSAQKALGGKFWTDFFKQLSDQAPGAVEGLGKAFGSILVGIAGIVKAFLPFVPTIVGGIQKAAAAFAKWGKGLGESQGFQTFVKFAAAQIPKIVLLFKNVGLAIGNIVSALAPFGSTALSGISALVGWVAKLSPSAIQAIALAIGGVVLGVKAWAIAQRILNVVLSKNPIGLIITAIGLLVAGLVYAYQNSETFRNIVDGVFKAIGAAATWLWETILKPAFDGLVWLWQNVLAPAATWLWQTILKPAFDAIGAAIKFVWETIVKPAFTALRDFLVNTLGPKILWFHENVVKPVFTKVGEAIKWAWTNVIQPAFVAVRDFLINTLGPKFLWFHTTIVKPVMDKVGEVISSAWEKVIKPAFSALWTFITETIPNGFKKGVELIGKFWDGLKKVAAAPVQFIVETVYNNGIAAVWNAVADALKLPKLPLLKFSGFAKGGIYPGYTPGRDVGMAAVSGGEAIMRPEWTRAVGSDFVHNANAAARSGGVSGAASFMQDRFMGAYAGGGVIGDLLAQGVKIGAEKLLNPMLDKAASMMGDSPFASMLIGIPKTLVTKVIEFLSAKEAALGGPGAGKALAFARGQIGKDYQWGATGPNTFDCSGLTMRAWQAGGRGDIPRTSQQQMGWVKKVAKPVPGALGFPHPGHVWLYSSPNTIVEAPQTGLKVREVAARAAQVIGVPPTEYDSGGYLPTGHSLVFNGTGSPEPVLTDQQWKSVQGGTQGGDGPMLAIDQFNATPEQSPQAIARELYWLSKGRPR